jgi:CubicO group peptidase (beta-lactamase class C family)
MFEKKLTVEFNEERIDAIFSKYNQCGLPGVAIGIAVNRRPVYRKGFGLANMELPVVLSPSIRMRIGSTTKHFTSLAYLLLCEDGAADIDDPIGKYLPELHPVTHAVTMRQIMGNVGGLRDVCDFVLRFSGAGRPVSALEMLSLYKDLNEVNAAPGTAWIYNNSGYVMLSVAIERIANKPLEEVFRERIFAPIGMKDTLLRRFDTDFVPNSAAQHMVNLDGAYVKSYFGIDFAGAGAIVSTVDDMLRWLDHMEAPTVGKAASWANLMTTQTLANGTDTGYGLGLMLGRYRGAHTLSHPGGGMGGNAQMIKVLGAGLDIVVIVNRHDAQSMELASEVIEACLPGLEPVPASDSSAVATGTFRGCDSGRILQLKDGGGQQYVALDGFELPHRLNSEGELQPLPLWHFLKRSVRLIGSPAAPDRVLLNDFGNREEFSRVPPAGKADARSLEGHYRSDSIGAEGVVRETDRGYQLFATGRFGSAPYLLEAIGQRTWRARPSTPMNLGGIVTSGPGGMGFDFFSYGNRALHFRRCD